MTDAALDGASRPPASRFAPRRSPRSGSYRTPLHRTSLAPGGFRSWPPDRNSLMGVPVLHVDHARLAGLLQPDRDRLALPVGTGTAGDLPLAALGIGHAIAGAESKGKTRSSLGARASWKGMSVCCPSGFGPLARLRRAVRPTPEWAAGAAGPSSPRRTRRPSTPRCRFTTGSSSPGRQS
jgi:hypothetical protein